MEHEFTFPSGLKGTLRPLKVKDEQLYTDVRVVREGKLIESLLDRCFCGLIDAGPYPVESGGAFKWGQALHGDGFFGFVQLRILSYGAEYQFVYPCENCRRNSDAEIDLNDLPIKTLPETSKQHLLSGQPFSTELGGKEVKFRLLNLRDERVIRMLRQNRKLDPRTAAIVQRIVSIEGVPEGHVSPAIKFVEDLDASELGDLEILIEDADCGIDTWINVDCKNCYMPQRILLPFEPTFYSKRKRYLGGASMSSIG